MKRSVAALILALVARAAAAQEPWPGRPVHVVVPYTPGTGADILARVLGPKLGERWKAAVVTDNKVRTVADVRHAFSKFGGNLGTDGSVAFLFKHIGQLVFAPGTDENKLMEAALDAGAEDVVTNDDGSFEVVTGPYDFVNAKDALAKAGFVPAFAEVTMKPSTEVEMDGEDAEKMRKLLDALESLDDVQEVYTSAVLEEAP